MFWRETGFAEGGEEGISRGGHAQTPAQLDERLVCTQNHYCGVFIHTAWEEGVVAMVMEVVV